MFDTKKNVLVDLKYKPINEQMSHEFFIFL
jgi:hypothetical protein